MKQYKSIFKPKLVRELLRLGNPIYDIKAWSEKNKKSPFEYAPLSNKQVYHDKRKRNYAQEYNIKLLEIWYYDFENIEEILKNELF